MSTHGIDSDALAVSRAPMPVTSHRDANEPAADFRLLDGDALILDVLAFEGAEELGRLFWFDVHVAIDAAVADRLTERTIVGERAALSLLAPGDAHRTVRGIVSACEFVGVGHSQAFFVLRLVPPAWVLTQRVNARIFQERPTPEIVRAILADHGLAENGLHLALAARYDERDYCVQYAESDWDFISRLMEEEGAYHFYREADGVTKLHVTDGSHGHFDVDFGVAVRFHPPEGMHVEPNTISQLHCRREVRPGAFAQTDYSQVKPGQKLLTRAVHPSIALEAGLEVFHYPGEYRDRKLGQRLTDIRLQERRSGAERASGRSDRMDFAPGRRFCLVEHPLERLNRAYTIVAVRHRCETRMAGDMGYAGINDGRARVRGERTEYVNEFDAIPAEQPFRPARLTPRPRMNGVQTAVVVGPEKEEIHTDRLGRVKVRFHWDRPEFVAHDGRKPSDTTCWIRVSQVHAGKGWGYIDIPRVGEEVIVDFFDGDPDQPVVVGRLYNGDHTPPFGLPGEKTRRGNTTHTYKGEGYNELTMDDTKDKEQIRIHAQRDLNAVVRNDETRAIGHDRSTQIANNETHSVGVDRTTTIANNDTLTVGNIRQTQVGVNDMLAVGVDRMVQVGNNIVEAAGNSVLITAGTSITLQCGAAIIHMNQAGVINIAGTLVNVAGMIMTNVTAPITTVSGLVQLNTGTLEIVAGGMTRVTGGVTTVDGNPVKINSV